jgi:hypothetical protein
MHTVTAPKKADNTVRLGPSPKERIPFAGKGRSTRFGNWRKLARTTAKVNDRNDHG